MLLAALQPIILVVAFVALLYFVGIRPQKRRQQELVALQQRLSQGDEVVTAAGIYGTITEVEEGGTVLLEISESTEIRIAAASIARIITDQPATDVGAREASDGATTPAPD